jgi:hypothetical protein
MAKKKDPGKYLVKQIETVSRLPKVLDSFVTKHPFLNEDESFVKAALAVKRTLQELRLPLNLLTDVATQFMQDDEDKEEED